NEESQSDEQQGPKALLPSGQVGDELITSRAASAEDRAVGCEQVKTRHDTGWTTLINVVFVVSIYMVWTQGVRRSYRAGASQPAEQHLPEGRCRRGSIA